VLAAEVSEKEGSGAGLAGAYRGKAAFQDCVAARRGCEHFVFPHPRQSQEKEKITSFV
jgi:hypothetical protein